MTSIEPALNTRRLPPISGMLDELVDQAVRARRRRVMAADQPGQTLAALQVSDDTLDRCVTALRIYGDDAAHALNDRLQHGSESEREAAAFVRLALAVQRSEPQLATLAAELTASHPRAVHEALWFFPCPGTPLAERNDHIDGLLAAAVQGLLPMELALRLTGQRDAGRLRAQVLEYREGAQAPFAAYALAALGVDDDALRGFVDEHLHGTDATLCAAALEAVAVHPALAATEALLSCVAHHPCHVTDPAWAALCSRDPRLACEVATQDKTLPPELTARLLALRGDLCSLVDLAAVLLERNAPALPHEADTLLLILGELPAELMSTDASADQRSKALRQLLLRVCRHAHVGVRNDADLAPWSPEALFDEPTQVKALRLRFGQRLSAMPALPPLLMRLTHGLRQWLYVERAWLMRRRLSLSAWDVARRQVLALSVAETMDELPAG